MCGIHHQLCQHVCLGLRTGYEPGWAHCRCGIGLVRHVQKVVTIQRYARGFLVRLRMWRQATT